MNAQDEQYTELCEEYDKLKLHLDRILSVLYDEDLIRIRCRLHKKGHLQAATLVQMELNAREH